MFSPPASKRYQGKERRIVEPRKGALSSGQHRLGVGDLGRQMVRSAQEGVGKQVPKEMGFPRHQDGHRAGLRLHPVRSSFLMPVAPLLCAAHKPSVAPRCLHPKVHIPEDFQELALPTQGTLISETVPGAPYHRGRRHHALLGSCLLYSTLSTSLSLHDHLLHGALPLPPVVISPPLPSLQGPWGSCLGGACALGADSPCVNCHALDPGAGTVWLH